MPEAKWTKSESVGKLIEALSKAQLKFDKVLKGTENPAYVRSGKAMKYADLAAVIEATQPHLATEGLSVIQMPHAEFGDGDAKTLTLTTMIAHSSGEWIAFDLSLPAMMRERFDAQSVGSAITYARRYALAAVTGVAQEDDDANKASGIGSKQDAQKIAANKLRTEAKKQGDDAIALTEWKEGMVAISGNGLSILKAEVAPEELKALGFKLDGNVVTIPASNAFAFEDIAKRANVPLHWAKSAKEAVK